MVEGKLVTIKSKSLDKYGRPLVVMFADGINVNDAIIEAGFSERVS